MLERVIKFNGKTLKFLYRDESDQSVIDEFFVDKMYRSVEYQISNIKYPILDIGAHIGIFSIYASILNPQSQIFAIEPEPENFKLLKHNLKLNGCKNVKAIHAALVPNCHAELVSASLSSHGKISKQVRDDNTITLYLSKNTHNHSTVLVSTDYVQVPAINLERLIKENKIKKIGLLKMDMEGAEFEIISNIKYPIFNHIQNLVVEYHHAPHGVQGKSADYLTNIIRPHGFSVEHFPNKFDKKLGLLIARNKRK